MAEVPLDTQASGVDLRHRSAADQTLTGAHRHGREGRPRQVCCCGTAPLTRIAWLSGAHRVLRPVREAHQDFIKTDCNHVSALLDASHLSLSTMAVQIEDIKSAKSSHVPSRVIIIGAGVFGLSTALAISSRYPDTTVIVVDRMTPPVKDGTSVDTTRCIRSGEMLSYPIPYWD